MMEQAALRGSSTGRGLTRVLALVLLPLAILGVLTYSCLCVQYIPQNTGAPVNVAINASYMCFSLLESVIGIVFAIGAMKLVSEGRHGGVIAASTLFIILALGSIILSVVAAAVDASGWEMFVSLLMEGGMTLVSNIVLAVIAFILLHWFRTGSNPRTARVAAILSLVLACANEAFYVTISSDVEFISMFDSIILYVVDIVTATMMVSLTFDDDPLKGFAACLTVFGFTTIVMAVCGCVGTASNAMNFVAEHPSYRDYASQFLMSYLVSISSIVFECIIFIFLGFSATHRAAGKPAAGFIAAMVMAMVFAIPAIALSVWQVMVVLGGYGSSTSAAGLAMLLVELVAQIIMLASAAALIGSTKPAENHVSAMTAASLWSIAMLIFAAMGIFVMVGDSAGIFTTSTRLSGVVAEVLSAIVMPLVVCGLKSLPQPIPPMAPQPWPQPRSPQQQPVVQPMAAASVPTVPLIPRMPVAQEAVVAEAVAQEAVTSEGTAQEAAAQEAVTPEGTAQETVAPEDAAQEDVVAEAHQDRGASDCEVSDLGMSRCVPVPVAAPDEESDERHDDVSADGEDK